MFPYIADTSDLYNFYLRNLPSKTFKTYASPMPRINLSNEQIEDVKRLPWKSKMKVKSYMDNRKLSEE